MADQDAEYFAKIRSRPYDQAAERARNVAVPAGLGGAPGMFDPKATKAAVGYVAEGANQAIRGALQGPLDAVDTATRKVGGVANWAIDKLTPEGNGGGFFGQPMKAFPDLQSPRLTPEIPGQDPESLAGGLSRGISTFMTLYGPVAGQLGAIGNSPVAGSMVSGAFADMMAFENKTGTVSDVLRELGLDNALTQSLSGELSDDEWEASLKAAVEGAGLGFLGPVIRGVRNGLRRWPDLAGDFLQRVKAGPASGSPAEGAATAGGEKP